jgi:peptidoglycan/xylan/chitin deacetylase (PgdA/CDA1 family)
MTAHPSRRITVLLAAVAVLVAACAGPDSSESPRGSGTPTLVPPISSASASPSDGRPSPSGGAITYTVMSGDTLSSIGRAWRVSVAQLLAWNSDRYPSLASDPNALEVGWRLVVSADPAATPLPTATPIPVTPPPATPAPAGSGCRAGNRVAAGNPQTFYTVPGAGNGVALTLDMGGRLDPGVDIMNLLIARRVCVTLFPTGAMAQTTQGQRIMDIVRAHPELFEIGNHTMHHCDLVRGGGGSPTTAPCDGGPPSASFIKRELTDAGAILEAATGQRSVPYWRPPYGSVNDSVIAAAASVGYTKTFMWDIDTIDWKPIEQGGPTAEQIAAKVITQAKGGSTVLMHLGGYETLDALKIIIPGLRDRGFLLTSVSDLLN